MKVIYWFFADDVAKCIVGDKHYININANFDIDNSLNLL